jgi:porphobilinogen deaminase
MALDTHIMAMPPLKRLKWIENTAPAKYKAAIPARWKGVLRIVRRSSGMREAERRVEAMTRSSPLPVKIYIKELRIDTGFTSLEVR